MSITDNDPFFAPATGGNLKSLKGRLLLVFPLELGKGKSKFPSRDGSGTGLVDTVSAKVVVLDDADEPGRVIAKMKIMSASMYSQIAPYVGTGKPVLGRLGKMEFDLGEGWVLEDENLTDDDMNTARKWIADNPAKPAKDPFARAGKPTN